jgi:D-alanine-D-alanine ligase
MEVALKCDKEILIEEYLTGQSATVGVLERKKEDGSIETFATPILGFKTKTEWYDYEAKYTKGLTEFILPADFDEQLTKKIQELAILAHKTCGCCGVSRVDFLVCDGIPYILEINTNPGMTDTSDLPAQANAMGIDYNELVDIILKSAEIK